MGMNALVRKVLTDVGIKPERFGLQWASAAEAPRFVKLITEFTQQIRDLGPIGQAEGLTPEEVKTKINIALNVLSSRKLRVGFGNATKTVRKEGDFNQEHITEVFNEKLSNSIASGLVEEGLLVALQKEPANLTSLSEQVGASKEQAEKILTALSKQGKVTQKGKKWAIAAA